MGDRIPRGTPLQLYVFYGVWLALTTTLGPLSLFHALLLLSLLFLHIQGTSLDIYSLVKAKLGSVVHQVVAMIPANQFRGQHGK